MNCKKKAVGVDERVKNCFFAVKQGHALETGCLEVAVGGVGVVHTPVMRHEVAQYLNVKPFHTIVDCTVGEGGHAERILAQLGPAGLFIGIDQDAHALNVARQRVAACSAPRELVHDNFVNIDRILRQRGIDKVEGILLDLGVSSFQLESAERGFSIKRDGPLDMRMNTNIKVTARDLLNVLSEKELHRLFEEHGEDPHAGQIARAICRERDSEPIVSTRRLARIVAGVVSSERLRRRKIHPATQVFQALRIAVNCELDILEKTLRKMPPLISPGGRLCVISYHSLEDRIVKRSFSAFAAEKMFKIRTKKPLIPQSSEIIVNPRARSAKLRVAERMN